MIDLLREHQPTVTWLKSLGDVEALLPGIVAMELIQGCRNATERQQVERVLGRYAKAWPSPLSCEQAYEVFSCFHLSHGIGIMDALIGMTAVERGLTLYTFNQKHMAVIPDLKAETPYEKEP